MIRSTMSAVFILECTIFLLIAININSVASSNILGLFTTPFKSHLMFQTYLMKGLAAKGHNVTVITTLPQSGETLTNYRQIYLEPHISYDHSIDLFRTKIFESAENDTNLIFDVPDLVISILGRSNHTINNPKLRKLMLRESFDLLVLGWMANDYELGIAGHFKCPSIILGATSALKPLRDFVGNPADITHVSTVLLGYTGDMTFFQRAKNIGAAVVEHAAVTAFNYFYQSKYYEYNFPAKNYPTLNEMKENVSLVLVNHHFSQGTIRAYVPGMIEVGGLHIKPKPDELDEELADWLDAAENGVILFSFGAYLKSSDISVTKQNEILKVFSKLQQLVLITWEEPDNIRISENVIARTWLPQQEILAHPNVKLFISNCGVNSINEAKYHGVPVLGIPVYGDQLSNANVLAEERSGLILPYVDLNEDTFYNAIEAIINNSSFYDRAKSLSNIYKDRPLTALDTAIYWVEYVMRHHGAKHVQSPAVHMNFFQFYSLDIIGAVIFLILRIYFTFKGIGFVYRKIKAKFGKVKVE